MSQQPPQMKTLFKLGGEVVTSATHVIVYNPNELGSQECATLLAQYLTELTPSHYSLQLMTEDAFLHAREQHSLPSNDGTACRIPFVVGRCEKLAKTLEWKLTPTKIAAAPLSTSSSSATPDDVMPKIPDWLVRTHAFPRSTFTPPDGLVSTNQLALHFFSHHTFGTDDADPKHIERNTKAAVLWFAKEILACDITKPAHPLHHETTPTTFAANLPQSQHHILSPLPNAQINIDRLSIEFTFPHTYHGDLVKYIQHLHFLVNAENAELEMEMAKVNVNKPAPIVTSSSATSSSTSSSVPPLVSSPLASPGIFTPSPSPPVAVSSLTMLGKDPLVKKHTPLQPLPHAAPRRHGKPMLAVDLDEVLGQFVPALLEFHNKTYGSNHVLTDYHSYHFASVWLCTNEEAQERVHAFFESEYFQDIPTVPGALETLTLLKQKFDMTVVTSRQHSIEVVTRKWLDKHYPGIFTSVLFGNHYGVTGQIKSKPEMVLHIGAVALIDDSLTYARQCSSVLEKVILFDRDGEYAWNRNHAEPLPSNVIRCLSWELIREQLEEWEPIGMQIQINAEPE